MRVVFFGTGAFAVPALESMAPHLVLVVSQPDRPSGRGLRLHASPVKQRALELGLHVETPERSRAPEFVEHLRSLDADFLLVASYGQILSQAVLDSARQGGINLHGSILPAWRGAAPIQRCLEAGETVTGVTLMQMDRGMDTGDLINVCRVPIDPDETYGMLEERLARVAAAQVVLWAARLAAGAYTRRPQDSSRATLAPKVERHEARLRLAAPLSGEYNRYRAFTPNPGAFVETAHGRLRVWDARRRTGQGSPGDVVATSPELVVAFADGAMAWLEVQPEGKKRMSGRDFANGARIRAGDSLLKENDG
ncbi:MAG: methionyl-tRNA formyltransferase [Fimbriimonadaceae bacterium]|nr:methionyl-tRNA formyltransferase [Fimbriimonadaceae bacterium]